MKIGYARVSTSKQNIEPQLELLREYGCDKIYSEKKSGSSINDREELEKAIDFCREGDEFIFYKIDRIARNIVDLKSIIKTLTDKGVIVKSCDGLINTSVNSAMTELFINMLGCFAEFELNVRKERQEIGIEMAKEKGVYKGKQLKNKMNKNKVKVQVLEMLEKGLSKSAISKELNVSRAFILDIERGATCQESEI